MSALLELPQSTVRAIMLKMKRLGATMAQLLSRRPHKLTERDLRVLKHVAHKNGLSSIATLTTEFQTASGRNVSTRTVYRELHEVGYTFFFRLTNLGLVDCRRTLPASMHNANGKVWWRRNNGLRWFFMVWAEAP